MTIDNIKSSIDNKKGKKVRIRVNGSRNKKEIYKGTINETYSYIFTIKNINEQIKSFSYSDVLTKTVEIFFVK